MHFRVRALGATSHVQEIDIDAGDEAAARRLAGGRGLAVLSVTPLPVRASRATRFPLMLFNQELLALLRAGIALADALAALAEKEARPAIHAVLEALGTGLREGRTLSAVLDAQPQAFPALYVADRARRRAYQRSRAGPVPLHRLPAPAGADPRQAGFRSGLPGSAAGRGRGGDALSAGFRGAALRPGF